ncbi:hypothetical protein Hanom_Chr00s000004g01609921 [Helianthus anomalus]
MHYTNNPVLSTAIHNRLQNNIQPPVSNQIQEPHPDFFVLPPSPAWFHPVAAAPPSSAAVLASFFHPWFHPVADAPPSSVAVLVSFFHPVAGAPPSSAA